MVAKIHRIPVTLTEDENQLVIKLRAVLEAKFNKRISIAELVRMSIRSQAEIEGILS